MPLFLKLARTLFCVSWLTLLPSSAANLRSQPLSTGWQIATASDTSGGAWKPITLPGVFRRDDEVLLRRSVSAKVGDKLWLPELPNDASIRVNGKLITIRPPWASLREGRNTVLIAFSELEINKRPRPDQPRRYVGLTSAPFVASDIVQHHAASPHTITLESDKLKIDGHEVTLRGVTYVASSKKGLSTLSGNEISEDIAHIRTLGANCVRYVGNPARSFLDACHRAGLYVLLEPESMDGYRDHPAIIAYGVGRDRDDTNPLVREDYRRTASWLKRQEALRGRPVYFLSRFPANPYTLDIAVLSTSHLHDESEIRHATEQFRELHFAKRPYLLADFGPVIFADRERGTENWGSLEHQARSIYAQASQALAIGYSGVISGPLNDYKVERATAWVRDGMIPRGLYTNERRPRLAANALKAAFLGEHLAQLPSGGHDDDRPVSFIVTGFLFGFIFFLMMNVDRRFREYANRALTRPFNFFADIRDQRLIPNAQTTLLALILSVSVALVLGSLLYMFRNSYFANLWLLSVIPYDSVLAPIARIQHQPVMLQVMLTLAYFAAMLLLALVIRIAAIFVKQRIFFGDSLNIVTWSFLPLIVLLPIGMVLARLDRDGSTAMAIFWVLLLLKVWLVFRLLKGVAVLFDVYPTRVYLYYGTLILVVVIATVLHLDYHYSLFANLRYLSNLSHGI